MASRNGSPGSHSADTAGRCCTRRSTASRSARRSRASRSAYSSDGPAGETQTRQPPCPSLRRPTPSQSPWPQCSTVMSEERIKSGAKRPYYQKQGKQSRRQTFKDSSSVWQFDSSVPSGSAAVLALAPTGRKKCPTRTAWTSLHGSSPHNPTPLPPGL